MCLDEHIYIYIDTSINFIILVVCGDMTKEKTDVIVNAANTKLQHYGGVSFLIFLFLKSKFFKIVQLLS